MTKKKKETINYVIKLTYFAGLLGMILLILGIYFGKDTKDVERVQDFITVDQEWYLDKEQTKKVDLAKLGSYMDEKTGVLSLFYKLPKMKEKETLLYRSKDVYTKVFVGEEQLYETRVYDSRFYNRSPGNLWNRVDIADKYSEQYVEIQIYMVYDTNAITIDYTRLGDAENIIHTIVSDKLEAVFLSCMVIMIGIIMMFMQLVPVYNKNHKNKGIIYLGLYATLVGIWSLLETNIMQLYMDDVRIVQLLDNMVMIVDNIPLLFYLDYHYHLLKRKLIRVYAILQVDYIAICVIMQFTGIRDLHHLLKGAWICSFLNDALLIACAIYFCIRYVRTKKMDMQVGIQLIGILALIITAFISAADYTQADGMDRAQFLRVGMLFFVIFFGISSQLQTYQLIEQGLKYDIVKKLAYLDGLTGVGNRTAYLEHLEKLEESAGQFSLGIVFMDINNLKQANDNEGHDQGDLLILKAAEVIRDTFGKEGEVYRIGGDEFCVLMKGNNLERRYQYAADSFFERVKEVNEEGILPVEFQIAHGFSACYEAKTSTINKAIAEADGRMYSDKARLKERDRKKLHEFSGKNL